MVVKKLMNGYQCDKNVTCVEIMCKFKPENYLNHDHIRDIIHLRTNDAVICVNKQSVRLPVTEDRRRLILL